jgi:hypothetical protein
VKHIPETNGRVGILGNSYDGFLALMALVNPHPALKVAVPSCPMVDGWIGDDWFHNGAFRQQMMSYIYDQEATRGSDAKWWTTHFDEYEMFMAAGSAGELGRQRGLEQMGFWRKILEHPAYDAFWRDQAVDKLLAAQPLKVPMMLVHSLWDEDITACRGLRLSNGRTPPTTVPGGRAVASRPDVTDGGALRSLVRDSPVLPSRNPAALPRPVLAGRRAEGRDRTGHRVRDGDQCVAALARVAGRVRDRLQGRTQTNLLAVGEQAFIRGASQW